MDWYYVNNKGESVGPVDDEAFEGLIAGGTVNSDTSVWNNGLSDWLPYSEVGLNANPESQSIVDPVEDRGPQGFQFGGIGGELFKIYLVNVLSQYSVAQVDYSHYISALLLHGFIQDYSITFLFLNFIH